MIIVFIDSETTEEGEFEKDTEEVLDEGADDSIPEGISG